MNFNFDYGEYFRRQITAPIDEMNARIKAQTNSAFAIADGPRLAVQAQLDRLREPQLAIQRQIEKLTKLPDLPALNILEEFTQTLNLVSSMNTFDNVLSDKSYFLRNKVNTDSTEINNINLNKALIEINQAYTKETLSTQQRDAFNKVKTITGKSIYVAFNFTASSVLFYSTKAYRKLEETYADNKWKQSTLEASKSLVGNFIDQTISYLLFNNPYSIPFNVIFLIKALGTILYIIMSDDD